jgi:hypothetical protein
MAHDFEPGLVYLLGDSAIEPHSLTLAIVAAKMFIEDETRRRVSTAYFEGELTTDQEFGCLGGYTGIIYEGNFDIDGFSQPAKVRFLVHSCKLSQLMSKAGELN